MFSDYFNFYLKVIDAVLNVLHFCHWKVKKWLWNWFCTTFVSENIITTWWNRFFITVAEYMFGKCSSVIVVSFCIDAKMHVEISRVSISDFLLRVCEHSTEATRSAFHVLHLIPLLEGLASLRNQYCISWVSCLTITSRPFFTALVEV